MAIHIFCQKCKSSHGLDAKQCSHCGHQFGRNKKYRVTASVGGKRATKVLDNLTLAREAEAALKADLVRGQLKINRPGKAPKLDDIWIEFLSWAKEHKKTWRNDKYHYNKHLQPRFGNKRLDAIAPIDIERMKIELKKGISRRGTPYSAATIKHQIVLMKRLYNVASKWRIYKGPNPCDSVDNPKLDNQKTEFMTSEQLSRLLEVLELWPNQKSANLVKFALLTGFRRGEIFKLTWDDVDLVRGNVILRSPKGGKTETLPLSVQALGLLKSIDKTSMYVFPGKDGNQRTDFKGPWQRIRKAADLPGDFRFHGLRHHFASSLANDGVDLYTIGKLLSHKQISTTQRYAHLADHRLKKAANRSGVLLSPKQSKLADQLEEA